MNYVVFDLEWNQADPSKEEARESLPFEIIEIGAVKLDENMKKIGTFHRIIRPVVYPVLFSHTREIVNLTDEDLANGTDFKSACREFLSWSAEGGEYRFCTWGVLDLAEFQMNMAWHKIKNDFPRPLLYINVQQIFSISRNEESEKAYALETATELLSIPDIGEYHSALTDAGYTALIMQKLDKELLDLYPAADQYHYPLKTEEEIYIKYPDHNIYMTRAFKSREALKVAELHLPIKCSICGKRARRIIPWYTNNSRSYFTIGSCRKDGMLKVKRAIKNPDGRNFYEIQTVRKIDKDKADEIIKHHSHRR